MLIATLVLAFVSFVAFVNYILNPATWSLVVLFVTAGLGLILFVIDWTSKQRQDKAKKAQVEAFEAVSGTHEEEEPEHHPSSRSHSREFPGIGKTTSGSGEPGPNSPSV
ncbi:hypothetical protein ACTXN7_11000 [Corynebacterium flavescens]|uniref:hypothetical protein n=1 Tax=Corynebacterium flavescens TaxID=28028 RepID=UPI00257992D9|nr:MULTISPECIES: hypothetical protein [Corynebacterium]MDN6100584.1 hypothetical protein [Corynebacterium flavescens]MDN6552417.1 hypothetical protein [Corynebacterium flavescens]